MSELNSRQWALYNHLKDRGDQWTTQCEIARALPEYGYTGTSSEFHDSGTRMQMTADVRKINDSGIIQKIVISSPRGIKIASTNEFERYIRKEISAAVRRLMRAKRKAEKGNRDGQMRLVLGSERDIIKAFIDSDRAFGDRLKIARLRANLSQAQVVAAMHEHDPSFDAPMLSRFENGYCIPCKTTLSNLAQIYATTPETLLAIGKADEAQTGENDGLQVVKGG